MATTTCSHAARPDRLDTVCAAARAAARALAVAVLLLAPAIAGQGATRLGSTARSTGGHTAGAPPSRPSGVWPVAGTDGREPPTVVRGFEPPSRPWLPGHRGVDLAARADLPVRAAVAGRVMFVGTVAGVRTVTIRLTGSDLGVLRTTYQPVRAIVHVGEHVATGRTIGVLDTGPFHCAAGCLHWGLLAGARYLDPLSLIPPRLRRHGPSRLLPMSMMVPAKERRAAARPKTTDDRRRAREEVGPTVRPADTAGQRTDRASRENADCPARHLG